jgi:hypothetical protein
VSRDLRSTGHVVGDEGAALPHVSQLRAGPQKAGAKEALKAWGTPGLPLVCGTGEGGT